MVSKPTPRAVRAPSLAAWPAIGSALMDRLGWTVASAAAAALVLAACGGGGRSTEPAQLTPRKAIDLAVVAVDGRIGTGESHGSGIVMDGERGLVLTSAHTVWGARSLTLTTALGILHGRIVARAPCDDLALVETYPRIPGLVSRAVAPDAPPAPGVLLRSVGRRRADPDQGAH